MWSCRRRLHRVVGAGALPAALALAAAAGATPAPCPMVGGSSRCELTLGGSYLRVDGSSQDGGPLLVFDWFVDGVSQLFYESFVVVDLQDLFGVEMVLESATIDPDAGVIATQLRDETDALRASALFQLTDLPDGSMVDEVLVVQSRVATVDGRLYVIHDFDLDDDAVDDTIAASPDGSHITQADENTTATISVLAGPVPDAFAVAPCCALDDIVTGSLYFDLGDKAFVPGPDDFQSGMSWDRTLGAGQSFSVTLRKRITIPEPAGAVATAGALLTLLALLGCRVGRRPRAVPPVPAP